MIELYGLGVEAALASTAGLLSLVLIGLLALVILWRTCASKGQDGPAQVSKSPTVASPQVGRWKTGNGCELPHDHHLVGTFVPTTGLVFSNSPEPFPFENEWAKGHMLPIHRPTANKELMKSAKYPYGGHMGGRKRLWENRWQFEIKVESTDAVYFGLELEEYVPLSFASVQAMSATVAALKRAVGNDLYHSPGDNPKKVSGEKERPTFVMPIWAFDQFIETPPGETPPALNDPNMDKLGIKRTDDRAAFIKKLSNFQFKLGTTYTFCFWGISQWLDNVNWQLKGIIPGGVYYNKFCGGPPLHIVLYRLNPRMLSGDSSKKDRRHLDSHKNYFFRLIFWSSQGPFPSSSRMSELFQGNPDVIKEVAVLRKKKWYEKGLQSVFACCAPVDRRSS